MKNLNLIKFLKDCPKGMKLYTTIWGEVEFIKICDMDIITVLPISNPYNTNNTKLLYPDGRFTLDGECILFPSKENRDWSKFHKPFKDGDVVTCKLGGNLVAFIYKNRINKLLVKSHFALYLKNIGFSIDGDIALKEEEIVFATKEEKDKLFKAIKDAGYKWNPETKTLIELIEPKFKVGDKIVKQNSISNSWIVSSVTSEYYGLKLPDGNEGIGVLPVSEQDDWELVLVVPKFKVGDRVKKGKDIVKIVKIFENYYYVRYDSGIGSFSINIQDEWELLPNKFDINTLKPFDKVLVRYCSLDRWRIQLFEKYNRELGAKYPFICLCDNKYSQCIPYEQNKHLLDTFDDCDEYYKTWK